MSAQPSTAINIKSLNGSEMIVGDSINIPNASKIFATRQTKMEKNTKNIAHMY